MGYHWEIDLYFSPDNRKGVVEDYEIEKAEYYGRPAVKITVEADSYEHGSSGTLALYYEDKETNMMRESHSIRDDDLIGVEATRVGEPDPPEATEEDEDTDDWEQDAQ